MSSRLKNENPLACISKRIATVSGQRKLRCNTLRERVAKKHNKTVLSASYN